MVPVHTVLGAKITDDNVKFNQTENESIAYNRWQWQEVRHNLGQLLTNHHTLAPRNQGHNQFDTYCLLCRREGSHIL